MPRTYRSHGTARQVTPLQPVKPAAVPKPSVPPKWEDCVIMHDVKAAAEILTEKLGRGHTYYRLLKIIKSGELTEGYHWFKAGGNYKINIPRFIEWRSGL